jgi:hypothetical protein
MASTTVTTTATTTTSRPYYHDCALWGLAVDKSIQDLIDCLYKAGVAWEDVWCEGDTSASATTTQYPTLLLWVYLKMRAVMRVKGQEL